MLRFFFCMCLALPLLAQAVTLEKPLANTAQEARAQVLFETMRCVVCEGQPLAESDARHAVDMRASIRNMIASGDSDDAIYSFFRARYGDEIFMRPPAHGASLGLWLAPFFILLCAVIFMIRHHRQGNI